ncbi:MAG: FAD-dependent oxidoreductase [Deltaproteobacteria bacterium]|nr:FAD-dependent oxidoreductase [Deltaproteobacteria bacterium]
MSLAPEHLSPPLAGGTTEKNLTASWRHLKPVYRELISPCREECAAGVRPERFLHHLSRGKVKEAFYVILEAHPFPAIMGRVCYRECEKKCTRDHFDGAVAIGSLERIAGDRAIEERFDLGLPVRKNAGRAGVIGAGPAGLSFLYHMRKAGFDVTLFDMKMAPGGMLRHVIPDYRLPSKVVDAEIGRLLGGGINFVRKRFALEGIVGMEREFDILLVATGAWQSTLSFQHEEGSSGISDAIRFLQRAKESPISLKGKKVLVVGGGNSAIDSARAAIRLGADVDLFYRRDERDMPAYEEEVEEAVKEGVQFHFRVAPRSPLFEKRRIRGVKMIRTDVIRGKDTGPRGKVIAREGTEFEIPCDLLILATGEDAAFSENQIKVGKHLYIAGDAMRNATRNVTWALGSGKEAALSFLSNAGLIDEKGKDEKHREVAGADTINRDYVRPSTRLKSKAIPIARRIRTFDEVENTPTFEDGMIEAGRCLSCGVCNGCDNCRIFCPDGAVRWNGGDYSVEYDHCKGCGICWTECPGGAISFTEG